MFINPNLSYCLSGGYVLQYSSSITSQNPPFVFTLPSTPQTVTSFTVRITSMSCKIIQLRIMSPLQLVTTYYYQHHLMCPHLPGHNRLIHIHADLFSSLLFRILLKSNTDVVKESVVCTLTALQITDNSNILHIHKFQTSHGPEPL